MRRLSPLCALLLAAASPVGAAPPAERLVMTAVADADDARILVRWRVEEGTPRYALFDLLRREASEIEFALLNTDPIAPRTSVAEIQAVFTAPGRADALAEIQAVLGPDYASHLARLGALDPAPEAEMQRRLLPEWNYGAALVLGQGWLDEAVISGTTYVYELWGLDALGFRLERLGRATATAGGFVPLPAPALVRCVDRSGIEGHLTADLSWPEVKPTQPFLGYDVLRAPRAPDLSCPLSGAVRANRLPVLGDAPGRVAEGGALFVAQCAACHAGGRDAAPVAASRLEDFRRKQYPAPASCPAIATPHDTVALNGLTSEELQAIYDYIHEAQFSDDGSGAALAAGSDYCYWVAARDLLGQPGVLAGPEVCTVKDRDTPPVPLRLEARPILSSRGNWQTCEVSWRRNADGDTAAYTVHRVTAVPRCPEPVPPAFGTVIEPGAGERVVFPDDAAATGLDDTDEGRAFYYAVRALDAAGNASGSSAWVPCTPRDIRAPGQTVVTIGSCPSPTSCQPACPPSSLCRDRRASAEWIAAGGDPEFIVTDPSVPACCQVGIRSTRPDDTRFVRTYRCMDPTRCVAGPDQHVDPFLETLAPALDTKVWVGTRAFDASGNVGLLSSLRSLVIAGTESIPAPRILSARLIDAATNQYRIRFRAIEPQALLGFALYASTQEPGVEIAPEARGFHVVSLPAANLGGSLSEGDAVFWTVRPGAQSLEGLPNAPPPGDPYLIRTGDRVYEMVARIEALGVAFSQPVRFYLAGVGSSGREGLAVPFVPGVIERADGMLDWPLHPDRNPALPVPAAGGPDLSVQLTAVGGASPYMRVVWEPDPQCFSDPGFQNAPFVLLRRRDTAARWEQMAPLFVCWSHAPIDELHYDDADVQEGHWYSYTVVRLDGQGEFHRQHGPSTFTCFDTPEDPRTCTTPAPPE